MITANTHSCCVCNVLSTILLHRIFACESAMEQYNSFDFCVGEERSDEVVVLVIPPFFLGWLLHCGYVGVMEKEV